MKAQFTAEMGVSSAFTTLKVKRVMISPVRDSAHWETLAKSNLTPMLVIEGRAATYNVSAHRATLTEVEAEYPSNIILFLQGDDEETVSRNAKILLERAINVLMGLRTGFDGTDGKRLEFQPIPNRAEIFPVPLTDCTSKWSCVAILNYTFGKLSRGR